MADARQAAIEDVLGPLGGAVMRLALVQQRCTVQSVLDALNAERSRSLAYTTVMTIMSRLFERGLLVREKTGRSYVYVPVSDEAGLVEAVSQRAVDELIARFGTTALRQFAERLADADVDTRERILELARSSPAGGHPAARR